jgi:hypothetical protein
MLHAKLAISYRNIFTFFDKLKETFKFWASGCHVKGPLHPPLRTQDTLRKSCVHQVRTGGRGCYGRFYFSSLG